MDVVKAVITAVITVPSSSDYRNYGFTVITVNVTTVIQDLTSGLTRDDFGHFLPDLPKMTRLRGSNPGLPDQLQAL